MQRDSIIRGTRSSAWPCSSGFRTKLGMAGVGRWSMAGIVFKRFRFLGCARNDNLGARNGYGLVKTAHGD